jgi:hypothetical protein
MLSFFLGNAEGAGCCVGDCGGCVDVLGVVGVVSSIGSTPFSTLNFSTTPFSMLNFLLGTAGGAGCCVGDCGGRVGVVSSIVLVVSTTPFSMLNFLLGTAGGAGCCAGDGDCGGCIGTVSSVVLVVSYLSFEQPPFPCSIFFLEMKEVQNIVLAKAIVEAVLLLFHQSYSSFQQHLFHAQFSFWN